MAAPPRACASACGAIAGCRLRSLALRSSHHGPPACGARGWARRRDVALADGGGGYLASALLGYAGGCVALELVGGTGGPALIELVPAMLLGVLGRAAARGELTEALRGAPGTDGTDVPWR